MHIELRKAGESLSSFGGAVDYPPFPRVHYAPLADHSTYLNWQGLFEFLISPGGDRITCHLSPDASWESFQTYLLGHVLSFALIRKGLEPLHATVVVAKGRAVGLMGSCGSGKSTLAAALLQAGWQMLTDDMLVIKEDDQGFVAYPGPPRIKLFPEVARTFFGDGVQGIPMNNLTPKFIIPLADEHYCTSPTPLVGFIMLRPPAKKQQSQRVIKRRLNRRQAFLALIANTFNTLVRDPERLRRLFTQAGHLAENLPIKGLTYPRDFSCMPGLVESLQRELPG